MKKEFLPAINWLEQDYDHRSDTDGGWRVKPRYNPDGTYPHPERDLNTYRRGPYQIIDMPMCGEYLADNCVADTGDPCTHDDHQDYVNCWCLNSPSYILGIDWDENDEKMWLEHGNYIGRDDKYSTYLRSAHSYLFNHDWDERPNDIHFWKEEESATAA